MIHDSSHRSNTNDLIVLVYNTVIISPFFSGSLFKLHLLRILTRL